jgi:hypothetical protein
MVSCQVDVGRHGVTGRDIVSSIRLGSAQMRSVIANRNPSLSPKWATGAHFRDSDVAWAPRWSHMDHFDARVRGTVWS